MRHCMFSFRVQHQAGVHGPNGGSPTPLGAGGCSSGLPTFKYSSRSFSNVSARRLDANVPLVFAASRSCVTCTHAEPVTSIARGSHLARAAAQTKPVRRAPVTAGAPSPHSEGKSRPCSQGGSSPPSHAGAGCARAFWRYSGSASASGMSGRKTSERVSIDTQRPDSSTTGKRCTRLQRRVSGWPKQRLQPRTVAALGRRRTRCAR